MAEARNHSLSRPLKQSRRDADKPQKKEIPKHCFVRQRDERKESSKGVSDKLKDVAESLRLPVQRGSDGNLQIVNHKARGRDDPRRGDTKNFTGSESDPYLYSDSSGNSDSGSARNVHQNGGEGSQSADKASVASGRSDHSMGTRRNVNRGNGSAEGVHAAGVLPDNVHQDINRGGQPVGGTASVASRKSNGSTGTRRSVNDGNGSTRSVHQHAVGGGQVGDTASIANGKSQKSGKTTRSVDSGNGSAKGMQNIGGEGQSVDTASVASGKSNKSTKTKHSANDGNGSIRSVHAGSVYQNSGGPDQSRGDTASVTSRKSIQSTKSKHSVNSSKSNKSTFL